MFLLQNIKINTATVLVLVFVFWLGFLCNTNINTNKATVLVFVSNTNINANTATVLVFLLRLGYVSITKHKDQHCHGVSFCVLVSIFV